MLRRLLLLSMAIMVLACLSNAVVADDGPGVEWTLVTTHPDEVFQIGEQANVTVHVFSEGEYADPPNITFLAGINDRVVNLTTIGVGLFIAELTVSSEDLENDRFLEYNCFINGTDGESLGRDHGGISTRQWNAFVIDMLVIDPVDGNPRPGQVVEFLSYTTFMGEPVDPDDIVGNLIDRTGWHYIAPRRMAKGLYSFNYTLPVWTNETYGFNLVVTANLTNGSAFYSEEYFVEYDIDVFRVWAEIIDRSPSGAFVELWVTDMEGEPIEGAKVDLKVYLLIDGSSSKKIIINETSNGEGRVKFNASKYSRDDFYQISLGGTVSANGQVQYVNEDIFIDEKPKDISSTLLMEEDYDLPLEPGVTYILGFHLENDWNHTIWAHENMYVYIYDFGNVYLNENVVTDANGDFTVTFWAPDLMEGEYMRTVHLVIKTKGETYLLSEHDYLQVGYLVPFPRFIPDIDGQVEFEVGPLGPGREVNVTLDHPNVDGVNETAWVYWGPVPSTRYLWMDGYFVSDWEIWNDGDRTAIQILPCQWNGSAYVGRITLPAHVPNRVELYLAGVIAFHGPDDWVRVAATTGPIVFVATGPPQVQIDSPKEGETYSGTMMVSGRAFDDVTIVQVEVVIDELESWIASGTVEWSLELDTLKMDHGPHKIGVRAFDGISWSDLVEVLIHVNQPPEVTDNNVPEDEFIRLPFNLTGSAEDDDGVVSVIISFDWMFNVTANGTEEWWYILDYDLGLDLGHHFILVTVTDAEGATGTSGWFVEIGTGGPLRAAITNPEEGDEKNYGFTIEGTAAPTGGVTQVEVRINGNSWGVASGAEEWEFDAEMSSFVHGTNLIEVRAYDGQAYSSITTGNFTFDGMPRIEDFNWTMGPDSVNFNGTTTDDGNNLVRVEMRIDFGDWFTVNGTSVWHHELDIGPLTQGDHIVEVRAYDGNLYSWDGNKTFSINHRPKLEVPVGPTPSGDDNTLTFNGTASDSVGIVMITYRVDGGEWVNVTTTGDWSFQVDTGNMTSGEHLIEVRAYDGQAYSDTYTYTHTIEKKGGSESVSSLVYVAIGVVCIIALVAGVAFWKIRS